MKLKLAVLEKDRIYLKRLSAVFGAKYADQYELYGFTGQNAAMDALAEQGMDVLLAGEGFDLNARAIEQYCGFAYLVESPEVDTVKGRPAVCKYQRTALLCRQVQKVYAGHLSGSGAEPELRQARTILFTAVGGGVGTSTMAAACARRFAARGKRVLYLNLEPFGSPELYFRGEGQYTMGDVIAAVKGRNPDLKGMLGDYVRQDDTGVHFFAQAPSAADMLALDDGGVLRLLETLQWRCGYDCIVADAGFALDKGFLELMRRMYAIILVGSGSAASNRKTERAYEALAALERGAEQPLTGRMSILYNKVISKTSTPVACRGLRSLGGAGRYTGMNTEQLLSQLQQTDVFDQFL